ncbi:MAG: efflux transporter outer membrane subunit [Planctomycetota bacterium]|jgi:NodT family efflux transporter outer membrane factor (OMF) lipoprotein|nr:efflux transporter outer membrane subunit [Planctomycetota bacterium]
MTKLRHRRCLSQRFCLLISTGSFTLGSCTVGPDYQRPQIQVPDAWHVAVVEGVTTETAAPGDWWTAFHDPTLVELIGLADQRNFDLRIAASSIRQARSEYGIAAANLYPQLSLEPEAGFSDGNAEPGVGLNNANNNGSDSAYQLTMDLAWEIDLWGRVQRSIESQEADLEAEIEAWRDILITIRAEVAASYIEIRSYQMQIDAVEDSIVSYQQTLTLVEQIHARGEADEIELAATEATLSQFIAQLPPLREAMAKAVNRLSSLIGEYPGGLEPRLAMTREVPRPPASIGVGIPADVIRRRPDVREAERRLAAASALIGVAEASLYPALQINGAGGFSSQQIAGLFDGSQLGGMVGIDFSWPIFTAGRLEAVVDLRNEQARQALLVLQSTMVDAVEDVENALVAHLESQIERATLKRTEDAYVRVMDFATDRFRQGVDSLGTLLVAERDLLAVRQVLAVADGQVAASAVLLYKALGGGWNVMTENTSGAQVVGDEERLTHDGEQS